MLASLNSMPRSKLRQRSAPYLKLPNPGVAAPLRALQSEVQELFAGLETGKPFRRKRAPRGVDLYALRREIATLERSVQKLKEFISSENRHVWTGTRAGKLRGRKN
jgi:hypothetical protein